MPFMKLGKTKDNIVETGILEKKEEEVILKVASKNGKKIEQEKEKNE